VKTLKHRHFRCWNYFSAKI